jgi:hypothetical protein
MSSLWPKAKRVMANVEARHLGDAKGFYEKVLSLEELMNHECER